eukprot:snap_masked-scaffold_21-processed-gene-2.29-mRNA-1 protein AED:1.00 eAED:1.00 QI:0/0/0/0/1/1/2/0/181
MHFFSTEAVYQNSFFGSRNLPKLNSVRVSFAEISTLPEDIFKGNEEQIEGVTLSYGNLWIGQLTEEIFPKLTNLKRISLNSMGLQETPDLNAIRSSLYSVEFYNNQISTIFVDDFCSGILSSSLEYLFLSYNSIEFVEDDAFRNYTALTYLSIRSNFFNETEEHFKERTGFCQLDSCFLSL